MQCLRCLGSEPQRKHVAAAQRRIKRLSTSASIKPSSSGAHHELRKARLSNFGGLPHGPLILRTGDMEMVFRITPISLLIISLLSAFCILNLGCQGSREEASKRTLVNAMLADALYYVDDYFVFGDGPGGFGIWFSHKNVPGTSGIDYTIFISENDGEKRSVQASGEGQEFYDLTQREFSQIMRHATLANEDKRDFYTHIMNRLHIVKDK